MIFRRTVLAFLVISFSVALAHDFGVAPCKPLSKSAWKGPGPVTSRPVGGFAIYDSQYLFLMYDSNPGWIPARFYLHEYVANPSSTASYDQGTEGPLIRQLGTVAATTTTDIYGNPAIVFLANSTSNSFHNAINISAELPSFPDNFFIRAIFRDGVPKSYPYRKVQDPSKVCTVRTPSPTPSALPSPSSTPSATPTSQVFGDPHVVTADGIVVTYISCGDFTMLRSNDNSFRYQARHCMRDGLGASTCSIALQCSFESDIVEIHTSPSGVAVFLAGSRQHSLELADVTQATVHSADVTIKRSGKTYDIECASSGFSLTAYLQEASSQMYLDASVYIPRSYLNKVRGLMGAFDGKKDNDIVYADGRAWNPGHGLDYVSMVEHESLRDVEASWEVSPADSLFSALGDGVAILQCGRARRTLLGATLDSPEHQVEAQSACLKAGFKEGTIFLRTCIFDYTATGGNIRFAQNALRR